MLGPRTQPYSYPAQVAFKPSNLGLPTRRFCRPFYLGAMRRQTGTESSLPAVLMRKPRRRCAELEHLGRRRESPSGLGPGRRTGWVVTSQQAVSQDDDPGLLGSPAHQSCVLSTTRDLTIQQIRSWGFQGSADLSVCACSVCPSSATRMDTSHTRLLCPWHFRAWEAI